MNYFPRILPALILGNLLVPTASAAVVRGFNFSGDFSASTGTLNVLGDTTFTVTGSGTYLAVAVDEATALATGARVFQNNYFTGVQYSINGTDYSASFTFAPRSENTFPGLTPNDAYIFTSQTMTAGDVVGIKQGSYTGAANASGQMAALEGVTVSQSYLFDTAGPISDIVTAVVPEPEVHTGVAATGLVGFGLWRRRRAA